MKNSQRQESLSILRALLCILIVLLHVYANNLVNFGYSIYDFSRFSDYLFWFFGDFVFLFMIISAFSLCCGYYTKVKECSFSADVFYRRRYSRILSFFALMCGLDFIVNPSKNTLYEIFANLTLCFGFLPNHRISVIGVGWYLGVAFAFYICFPFFCFLINNKKRAWASFLVSIVFSTICCLYFFDSNHVLASFTYRTSIVYCFPFFILGGLLFLHKDELIRISKQNKFLMFIVSAISTFCYFYNRLNIDNEIIYFLTMLMMFGCYFVSFLGVNYDKNKNGIVTKLISILSSLSLEIYLCHMLFYRILEKIGFISLINNEVISLCIISALVITISIVFSYYTKKALVFLENKLKRIRGPQL